MSSVKAAFNFAKNIRSTGAIFETSHKAADEISHYVSDQKIQVLVEYGAGYGNITRKILSKMHPNSRLYAFEINKNFCDELNKINDARLTVINDSAQFLDKHVKEDVDCILSTIPFTLINNQILHEILAVSHKKLHSTGVISQILYSSFHDSKYEEYFKEVSCKRISYIPLEYVYHSKK